MFNKSGRLQVQSILHSLYDLDVLDEGSILAWSKGCEEEVRERIERFITWLEEADEESSDDD